MCSLDSTKKKDTPQTGLLIMKQARIYHEEQNIESECDYWEVWSQKSEKHLEIKYLKKWLDSILLIIHAENYIDKLAKIMSDDKNLSSEQIYNTGEIALHWCYVPRKALTMANKKASTNFRDATQRLTVLGCANAAGTHKLKLAVTGWSPHPNY